MTPWPTQAQGPRTPAAAFQKPYSGFWLMSWGGRRRHPGITAIGQDLLALKADGALTMPIVMQDDLADVVVATTACEQPRRHGQIVLTDYPLALASNP